MEDVQGYCSDFVDVNTGSRVANKLFTSCVFSCGTTIACSPCSTIIFQWVRRNSLYSNEELSNLIFFSLSIDSRSKVLHLLKMVVVLLCAPPLCLVYFCSAYISLFSLVPNTSILQVLTAGSQLALEGTVMAYNSWHFVGSWIFFVTCTVVWPLWLMSWVLCSSRQEEHEKQHVD